MLRRIARPCLGVAALLLCAALSPAGSAHRAAAGVPVRILAVGDSRTADGRWQVELSRLLTAAGVAHTITTEAVGGTRCSYWPSRIAGLLTTHQPDMVALFCGTNDDPDETIYGEAATGWAFRATVEAIHNFRPANPIRVLPALIQYSDPLIAPQWLLDNEPRTNDTLWTQMRHYPPADWFAGIADLQRIPATATYLDGGGIHPTAEGYRVMGRIAYTAAAGGMGWPPAADPPLCDMYGHRKSYPRPPYTPCPD